ncbi:Fusaric acid resistance protein-like-domain-containing protein [Cerioporus squamosus]|nr:Fusaric acid resistance protein-like-domain-containing protein [Cerioporus squamosus]
MDTDSSSHSSPAPMPIPASSRQPYLHDSPSGFVGSPEQLGAVPSSRSVLVDSSSPLPSNVSRPSFQRSASTMTASQTPQTRDRLSRVHELASSFARGSRHVRSPEHEWTVFGQLMAEEDAFRNVASPRSPAAHHSTPRYSSPRPLTETTTSSYFDRSASAHGVHDPFETEHTHSIHDPGPRASSPMDYTSTTHGDYSDSESDASSASRPRSPSRFLEPPRKWYTLPKPPALTTVQRNILKCAIAYFIGSLFTFSPYLSGFIADITGDDPGERTPSPSGTHGSYCTLGGMVEADIFCLMGLVFATLVSLSSMSVYWFFELQPGWEWLADALVLFMIGFGMSVVAWMKVWMAKPSFNTVSRHFSLPDVHSLCSVVKEGGIQTLMQVACIVLVGAVVSNVVCLFLWPQRATKALQSNMTLTLDSFATLLGMLTQTFLLEEPHGFSSDKLQRAVTNHQASFTSLKKSLVEAQSERLFGGPGKVGEGAQLRGSSGQSYVDAIDSLNRLGQHLNGLRSGISLQYQLIKGHREGKVILKHRAAEHQSSSMANGKGKDVSEQNGKPPAATVFGDLVDDLAPPLKALSTTCISTLKRLREAFVQPRSDNDRTSMQPTDFVEIADSIERALFTFESTSNHAVLRMYRSGNVSGVDSRASIASLTSENQVLMGDESENVFLAYFFIFTMQEYARELISLVDAMSRICSIERANAARSSVWGRFRALLRLPWRPERINHRLTRGKRGASIRKRFSAYFTEHKPHKAVSFPKVTPHAPNTIQTPARENLTLIGRVKQSLWALGARMKQQDMKYAIKAGMATAFLASPAFFESTRPMFVEYRGEWALISFFVVISPTIGATNFLGVHRVLGTLLGAATAFVVWSSFPENAWVLSIFGFFYSIPCFYYIVAKPQYATSARFVLLTYNLTCLYCYNIRQKDVAVFDIAFQRALAVTIGVVWAAIVSRYWWPAEARRELSRALGEFCLNVGWLYTRLVAFNSFSDEEFHLHVVTEEESPTEESHLLHVNPAMTESIQHFMAMELHLQIKLIELQGLLAQTQHEPRLKGPFPVALYRSILTSLQSILDRLHSMRCVTSREEWHTTVRTDFIIPVNRQRREMVGNVILYFSVLASAFRLKSPLPPYLPPAEDSRLRLVEAIRKLDVVRNRDIKGSRHLLFFAYALTMKAVIQELDYLGRTLQDAFGVIGQSREAFESLFEAAPDSVNSV